MSDASDGTNQQVKRYTSMLQNSMTASDLISVGPINFRLTSKRLKTKVRRNLFFHSLSDAIIVPDDSRFTGPAKSRGFNFFPVQS